MSTRTHLGIAAASLFAAVNAFAVPEVIFDNTAGAPDNNLGAVADSIYADDVTFGGTARQVTQLDISVLFADVNDGANMQADITAFLYDVGPGNVPGAVLWSATNLAEVFDVNGPDISRLVSFTGINVTVGSSAFWGVRFSNIQNVTPAVDFFGVQLGSATSTPAGSGNFLGTGPANGGIFISTAGGPFVRTDITGEADALAATITADVLVPEPTTASLFGVAALVLRFSRRRSA